MVSTIVSAIADWISPLLAAARLSTWVRRRIEPLKSTSTTSAAVAATLTPMENAPSGLSRIGVSGGPTRPRWTSPGSTRPSFSSARTITDTVCAESPLCWPSSIRERLVR